MNQTLRISPVIDQLETILGSGEIAAPYDRWGARLLAHLTRPVRIVVTGFQRSGKSALIEMLSGRPVLGHQAGAPMTELVYGETARTLFERQDGSVSTVAGYLKDHTPPDGTSRACQELPDTTLLHQNYTELGLSGSTERKARLLQEALPNADIMIWCTQDFDAEEQALWEAMPDAIKDHSLLALTMADRQMMRGVLTDTIARLQPIVSEEFLGLFPVATIQGITARISDASRNDALWASCGGKSLMDVLAKQVTQGRSVDIDRAQIFLDRLTARMPTTHVGSAEPGQTPETAPQSETPTTQASETTPLLNAAIDLLQSEATKMIAKMDASTEFDSDLVLGDCGATMAALSQLLDSAQATDPGAEALRADLEEGEELLMLFQLERGEEAALDAVTLLLQLRKELADNQVERT